MIEILALEEDNNIIEFKCLNKDNKHKNHGKKTMLLKDYLESMKKHNNKAINDDSCYIHNNSKFIAYCISCCKHLCIECLKSKNHINHIKNNIVEIQPTNLELNIIEEVIKYYDLKKEYLMKEKINNIKKLENILNNKTIIERKIISKNEKKNKEYELKLIKEKFISDIEEIKKEYEEKIKLRKDKYLKDINLINNKFKLIKDMMQINNKCKINGLEKIYNEKIKNIEYIKKITRIIYNTYNNHYNNYFNSININNILLNYIKSDYIKNRIMK